MCDTARVLVEHGQIDPMSANCFGRSMLHQFSGSLRVCKYLVQLQQEFSIDLFQEDSYGQDIIRSKANLLPANMSVLIRFLLGEGPISSNTAKEVWHAGWGPMTFFLGAARRLSANYQDFGIFPAELEFLSELIAAGADLHARGVSGATALDHILCTWWIGKHYETNKECLIFVWLRCLSQCGIDLHEYFRKEEELHENGEVIEVNEHRKWIVRRFTVYYGASRDDVTLFVEDVWKKKTEDILEFPGAWDLELEYAETHNLHFVEDLEPTAAWSVTTSGFQHGQYGADRASCDEDVPTEQRRQLGYAVREAVVGPILF